MNEYDVKHIKALAEETIIRDMFKPVRCTCGQIYDLGKVEVEGRYADCSTWHALCCGRYADDRGETGWKSTRDYTVIDKHNSYSLDHFGRSVIGGW